MALLADDLPDLVHGFAAEDWLKSWNTSLEGTIFSMDFVNEIEFHVPTVREMPIQQVRSGGFEGGLSARMQGVMSSRAVVGPRAALAELEIRLEEGRRDVAPQAPSRISCLYVAVDDVPGRNMVRGWKGFDAFLVSVRSRFCLRAHRADPAWIGLRMSDEDIRAYWAGGPQGESPVWEYLIDGILELTDPADLARLKDWGSVAARRVSDGLPVGTPRSQPGGVARHRDV